MTARHLLALPAVTLIGALSVTACGTDVAPRAARSGSVPVVVDTDVGPDDVIALLYLLRHPDVDVRAVTVAGTGLAHCDAGVARVLGLLALAEREGVPVACGAEEPSPGGHPYPDDWRAYADTMPGMDLPHGGEADPRPSVDLLADVITDSATPVRVVTLGPLTNLAALLTAHPEVSEDVADVRIMGGAVTVPGNVSGSAAAEWNVYSDPAAAATVLASGLPITLVPLDATNDVPLTIHLFRALEAHHDAPATDVWFDYLAGNPFQYAGGQYLWDEATVVSLTDPAVATYTDATLAVTTDDVGAGWTVVSSSAPTIRIATSIDRAELEARLLSVLAGTDVVLEAPVPDLAVEVADDGATLAATDPLGPGPVVLDVTNLTSTTVTVVVGRLTDGATEGDLRAVTTFTAPPWFLGEAQVTVLAGDVTTIVFDATEPGEHWIAAGTTPGDPPVIAGSFTLG